MSGKIFISYRRDDDPGFVHAIFHRLETYFTHDRLFMDVEGYIRAGEDFVVALNAQVAQCDVMLAIIGPRWLDVRDNRGQRRIDKPDDFVRIEISAALHHKKRVVPVLVNNARMPSVHALPDDLKPLSARNAIRMRHERFVVDCLGLANELKAIFAESQAAVAQLAAEAAREDALFFEASGSARVIAAQAPRLLEGSVPTPVKVTGEPRLFEAVVATPVIVAAEEPRLLEAAIVARQQARKLEAEADAARSSAEKARWNAIKDRYDRYQYERFIDDFPGSKHCRSIEDRIIKESAITSLVINVFVTLICGAAVAALIEYDGPIAAKSFFTGVAVVFWMCFFVGLMCPEYFFLGPRNRQDRWR